METNELKIIEQCRAGRLEEFASLYDLYARKIYNFIYFKTHHRQTAEDLTSQAFFKALSSIKNFDPTIGLFSSWLYRIARNLVIDYYRVKKSESDIADIWDLSSSDDPERDARAKEQIAKIKEYLAKLDKEQCELIIMRVWDGLSYQEIAEILDKTEAGCKMGFCRAVAKLRKEELLALVAIAALIIKI